MVTQDSRHKKAAHDWIDFMCRPDIALRNFEYIYYSTPNTGAMELMEEEERENEVLFPDVSQYDLEAYRYLGTDADRMYYNLGTDADRMYYNLWKEIKSA